MFDPASFSEKVPHSFIVKTKRHVSSPGVMTTFFPSSFRNFDGSESRFLSSMVWVYSPISIFFGGIFRKNEILISFHFIPLNYNYIPLYPTKQQCLPSFSVDNCKKIRTKNTPLCYTCVNDLINPIIGIVLGHFGDLSKLSVGVFSANITCGLFIIFLMIL